MTQKLKIYMCKYIQEQTGILKQYLLAAKTAKTKYLCYLDISLGTPVPSIDIKNCELLTEAGLFREEYKVTKTDATRYKIFYLTELGKEVAKEIREESQATKCLKALK